MDRVAPSKRALKAMYERYLFAGVDLPQPECTWCDAESNYQPIPPTGMASLWQLCDRHYVYAWNNLGAKVKGME